MRKFIPGILILVLIFGFSCTEKKDARTYHVLDFPEKIVNDGTLTGWDYTTLSVIQECFMEPIMTELKRQVGSYSLSWGYHYGKKTKRPIIIAYATLINGPTIFAWAYYGDELFKIVEEKYPGGWSADEAIEVLRPNINEAAKKLVKIFEQEKSVD